MKKHWRQGDILIMEVKEIPVGGKVRKSGHILEGEQTGHVHRISENDLDNCELLEIGERLFLNVSKDGGISIVHEDHKPIELPVGSYEITRQREYSPEAIRNVID